MLGDEAGAYPCEGSQVLYSRVDSRPYPQKLKLCQDFQHSLIFADKARSLPYSGAPKKAFTQVGYILIPKHLTMTLRQNKLECFM